MTTQGLKDRTVLLLISGMSADAAEGFCVQGGATPEQAKEIVAEARNRITIAADYTRNEQVGKAVMRLEDLYAKSMAAKDVRSALQAQRELNRLLALYADTRKAETEPEAGDDPADLQARLDLIAGYLVPLGLAANTYPVEEHARIAADFIRTKRGA